RDALGGGAEHRRLVLGELVPGLLLADLGGAPAAGADGEPAALPRDRAEVVTVGVLDRSPHLRPGQVRDDQLAGVAVELAAPAPAPLAPGATAPLAARTTAPLAPGATAPLAARTTVSVPAGTATATTGPLAARATTTLAVAATATLARPAAPPAGAPGPL